MNSHVFRIESRASRQANERRAGGGSQVADREGGAGVADARRGSPIDRPLLPRQGITAQKDEHKRIDTVLYI